MVSDFLGDLLQTITDRGRRLLSGNSSWADRRSSIESLCITLLSSQGEASGVALAKAILDRWEGFDEEHKRSFMVLLLSRFGPDTGRVDKAIEQYKEGHVPAALLELHSASEPRRQELIRRLNLASNGTATLVRMREALLEMKKEIPDLGAVDSDFAHLFNSWFNRGFLVLRPINWSTPANILEKIIEYEAVHQINGWDDLRRRLAPDDRRCFAFFHPQLPDDPLVFVEIALTKGVPSAIDEVLGEHHDVVPPAEATTAVFYSISNCHEGLRGVSFGNFLIKQVVDDLRRDLPNLDTFVTLSPVPGFAKWLADELGSEKVAAFERPLLEILNNPEWPDSPEIVTKVQPALMAAAARYLLSERNRHGRPIDAVSRFHLGNGARLERINFLADRSDRGMLQGHGLMVNYLYKLDEIETNHEAYASRGEVVATQQVRRLLHSKRASLASHQATRLDP